MQSGPASLAAFSGWILCVAAFFSPIGANLPAETLERDPCEGACPADAVVAQAAGSGTDACVKIDENGNPYIDPDCDIGCTPSCAPAANADAQDCIKIDQNGNPYIDPECQIGCTPSCAPAANADAQDCIKIDQNGNPYIDPECQIGCTPSCRDGTGVTRGFGTIRG